MAVSFTNNWKNILDKLENTLRTEFKGALPVYRGNKAPAGTTYLQLNPTGSELLEYNVIRGNLNRVAYTGISEDPPKKNLVFSGGSLGGSNESVTFTNEFIGLVLMNEIDAVDAMLRLYRDEAAT